MVLTNFIGCAASLKKLFTNMLLDRKTQRFAGANKITFHFLPPYAPHQGDICKRAVKSAKYLHLANLDID